MNIRNLRAEGRKRLKEAGIDSHAIDADVLLMHLLGIDKNTLLTEPDKYVDKPVAAEFWRLVDRRCDNVPVQYIVGKCEFMSLEFILDENVLIPRPDTEILVETVLAKEKETVNGLEIGVGSGCISISLEHYAPNITMLGVDISAAAVEIAGKNSQRLSKGKFIVSDMFDNVPRGTIFDFLVSNPPYIPSDVILKLEENVREYEPKLALDGGPDGLMFYRDICEKAKEYLADGGRIYFEIGHDQGNSVKHILCKAGFFGINIVKDLAGKDRVVYGHLPG